MIASKRSIGKAAQYRIAKMRGAITHKETTMKLKNAPGKKNDRRQEALAGLIIQQARARNESDKRRIDAEIITLRKRITDDDTARNTRTKKNRAA